MEGANALTAEFQLLLDQAPVHVPFSTVPASPICNFICRIIIKSAFTCMKMPVARVEPLRQAWGGGKALMTG